MTHQQRKLRFSQWVNLAGLSLMLAVSTSAFAQFNNYPTGRGAMASGASNERVDEPLGAESAGTLNTSPFQAPGMGVGAGRMPTIRQGLSLPSDQALQPDAHEGANLQRSRQKPLVYKPLPPNDFQKFVLENTGRSLPLFGADFFGGSAEQFAPQSNVPVASDYRLGPGDELQIRGWGAIDLDVRTVVDRNGMVHIPRVGAVSMAGVRSSQAGSVLRSAVGRYYRDFELSVTLGQLRGITVYVVGQARRPGAYSLSGASTLVSALFASGGPNATGSMRRVQVKRGDQVVTELDLYEFLARGNKSADIHLQDGDTIVIPAAKGYIALTGKVSTPAVYELAGEGDTVGSVLALAGGLPVVADPKRAYLERLDPTRRPARSIEDFALDASGLGKPLKSGDLLMVMSLSTEFGNAVTLRGNVEQPLRLPWKRGMTVRDLIPSKAFLMSRASVQRQNGVLLTEEEKRRVEEGFSIEPRERDGRGGKTKVNELREVRDNAETLTERIGNLVDEVNLEYAVVERVDTQEVTVRLMPFNLARALEDASSPDNLVLEPGDIVTVFSVNDMRVPQAKRKVFVRVEGEVRSPGIYQMSPGDGLVELLDKAGGLTPDAYLFGAAFYREEVRQTQKKNLEQLVRRLEAQTQTKLSAAAASASANTGDGAARLRIEAEAKAQEQALERLKNLNPTGRIMLGITPDNARPQSLPSLRLANHDRLVIPSRPDFVYVMGAVNSEASLLWRSGLTVQHYIEQSGLTSGADKDELFIIRADGSVASGSGGGLFSSISSSEVYPGDLIVLPEKTDHESAWSVFMRNAKDITQVVYQLSLGAAAIKTLRD